MKNRFTPAQSKNQTRHPSEPPPKGIVANLGTVKLWVRPSDYPLRPDPNLPLSTSNSTGTNRQLSAVIGTPFFTRLPFDRIGVNSTKFDFIFYHPLQVPVLTRSPNHWFPLSPLVSRICVNLRNSCLHAKSPASKAISSWCIVQTPACGSYLRQGWLRLVKVKKEGGCWPHQLLHQFIS